MDDKKAEINYEDITEDSVADAPPMSSSAIPGYFYIIKTSDTPANVYKIGKTIQVNPNKRLCQYPIYSECHYVVRVENADAFEDYIMRKLKFEAKRRIEYGLEYYEIEIKKLIDFVHQIWMNHGQSKIITIPKKPTCPSPPGWQYFFNEWLSKNKNATVDTAFAQYIAIIKQEFLTQPATTFEEFEKYFKFIYE